jgi:hypothetical protein
MNHQRKKTVISCVSLALAFATCAVTRRAPASTLHALLNVDQNWSSCSNDVRYEGLVGAKSTAVFIYAGWQVCQTTDDTDGSTASADCGNTPTNLILHRVQVDIWDSPQVTSDEVPAATTAQASWGPVVAAPGFGGCTFESPTARSRTFTGTSWFTDP